MPLSVDQKLNVIIGLLVLCVILIGLNLKAKSEDFAFDCTKCVQELDKRSKCSAIGYPYSRGCGTDKSIIQRVGATKDKYGVNVCDQYGLSVCKQL